MPNDITINELRFLKDLESIGNDLFEVLSGTFMKALKKTHVNT
jgi:hypothetical protein